MFSSKQENNVKAKKIRYIFSIFYTRMSMYNNKSMINIDQAKLNTESM